MCEEEGVEAHNQWLGKNLVCCWKTDFQRQEETYDQEDADNEELICEIRGSSKVGS
jgi:hypothetical protein